MRKRRVTAISCILLAAGIACLGECCTIKIGNPNNVEKAISGVIYTYLSMYVAIDLYYALNDNSKYLKDYHVFSLVRELALITIIATLLMLIFGILHNEKMNIPAIILFIIGGVLEGKVIVRAHKEAIKYLDLSREYKDMY